MVETKSDLYAHLQDEFKLALAHADSVLVRLTDDRWMAPGGNNGPHFAIESPVRNTCHWIVALLVGYRLTDSVAYLDKAESLSKWLLEDNGFYRDGCYVMRQTRGADWVNGVIGPAWVLEALSRLARYTGNSKAAQRARDIANAHKYDAANNGWCRFDPITGKNTVDYTYDHQAWYAAALRDLGEDRNIDKFLDALQSGTFDVDAEGRVFHLLKVSSMKGRLLAYRYRRNRELVQQVESGYHLYCLYPLARLYPHYTDHPFFNSARFQRSLDYCTPDNLLDMEHSRYGFAYNAPGLELPMVYHVFADRMPLTDKDVMNVYERQMVLTGDRNTRLHTRNNPDPLTLSARIYELALCLESLSDRVDGYMQD